jgi:hypothetical protein
MILAPASIVMADELRLNANPAATFYAFQETRGSQGFVDNVDMVNESNLFGRQTGA